jgi:uncharacterized protein (DUF2267 family)
VLGAVLRSIRDEMLVEQSAHFAAQLPLLVRGAYFDQYRPATQPASDRSQEDFIARIQHDLDGARPVNAEHAVAAVMRTLNRHVTEGQIKKVRDSLPKGVRALWPEPGHKEPEPHKAPGHAGPDGKEKSGQSATAAEQPSAPQHAAQPAPPRPAQQRAEPTRPAPHHPEPRHATPQSATSHPREEHEEIEEIVEEIIEKFDADEEERPSIRTSPTRPNRSAQVPVSASGRPAPGDADRTAPGRKTKSRTKRTDQH